jgi:hypothetical protein
VTTVPDLDDDALIAALRQAIAARRAVPDEVVAAARNAFAWRDLDTDIDAELARLTYDSVAPAEPAMTRAEPATIRALTFTSSLLRIELEVTDDTLLGQVVPAQRADVEVQDAAGGVRQVAADEIGCFWIQPIPPGRFRLHCRTASGTDISTGWVSL